MANSMVEVPKTVGKLSLPSQIFGPVESRPQRYAVMPDR
jgi:hypothetical protein